MFTHTPTRALAALALMGSLALTACSSGEPSDGDEQELITQVTLTLTPDGGGAPLTVRADFESDGTNPTFTPASLALTPGTSYTGTIELRDTFNNGDITEEIEGEAEEHLFRYAFAPPAAATVTITDKESDYTSENANGGDYAVGLRFRVVVSPTASGTGTMNAVLYHFDEAPKTSSTATSDEIDVDVTFPVRF